MEASLEALQSILTGRLMISYPPTRSRFRIPAFLHTFLRSRLRLASHYSFLNATSDKGGSVTAMECGCLCVGMGREETQPPFPILVPPNNSESLFRIS